MGRLALVLPLPQGLLRGFLLPDLDRTFGNGDGFALENGIVGVALKRCDHGVGLILGQELAGVVAEFFAPTDIGGEGRFEIGPRVDANDVAFERLGRAEATGIPRGDLAEEFGAMGFTVELDVAVEVAAEHTDALGEIGFGEEFAGGKEVGGAFEDPRIVERAAADTDAGAAGLGEHMLGGGGGGDVAVADDGNRFDGFDDGADAGEINAAGEALSAGAAVHENGSDAGIFEGAGKVGGGEVLFIPTETHFGGDGDLYGVDHAAHEGGSFGEFGHHGRAAADVDDLAHGAAHVDIDGLHAHFGTDDGRVAHLLGHGAEELDGEGFVLGRSGAEFEGSAVAFDQGAGVNEIGRAPTEATEFAHGEAHGQVGVSREWRQEKRGRK